ncbi:extracellular solute-binding protein [Candidatus Uhrbacteria bacterium]|nr:extracellular solute-binding protein [Candidatus Uhrbacteria bacterium]
MKKSKLFLALVLTFLVTAGQSCLKGGSTAANQSYKPVELNYWRVFDGVDTLQPLFDQYNKLHPNVIVHYRQLRFEEYEKELVNALAEDRGPDIFSIHNTWIRGYQSKLTPLPAKTILPTPVQVGTIKKEIVVELHTEPSLTLRQLKNNFIDQVAKDVVITEDTPKGPQDNIYGLPLGVDTLALFTSKAISCSPARPLVQTPMWCEPTIFWQH